MILLISKGTTRKCPQLFWRRSFGADKFGIALFGAIHLCKHTQHFPCKVSICIPSYIIFFIHNAFYSFSIGKTISELINFGIALFGTIHLCKHTHYSPCKVSICIPSYIIFFIHNVFYSFSIRLLIKLRPVLGLQKKEQIQWCWFYKDRYFLFWGWKLIILECTSWCTYSPFSFSIIFSDKQMQFVVNYKFKKSY